MDVPSQAKLREDARERLVIQEERALKNEKIKKKLGNGKEKKRIPKIGEWAIGHGSEEPDSIVDVPITHADLKKEKSNLSTTSLREIGSLLKRETSPNPLIRFAGTSKPGNPPAKNRTLPVLDYVPPTPAPPTMGSPVKRPFTPPLASSTSPSTSPASSPAPQPRLPPLRKYVAPTLGEDSLQNEQGFVDEDGLPHFFPLDHFDDYTFEVHSPEEWLKNGPVKASSKWFNSDGKWAWAPCIVESYNAVEGKYMIEWADGGKKKPVSRLNLLFDDEDKANFQNRVESAFQFRFYCETLLRRAIRLEKKDLEKIPALPTEIVHKILQMVKSTPAKSISNVPFARFTNNINGEFNGTTTKLQSALRTSSSKKMAIGNAFEQLLEETRVLYKRSNKKLEYDTSNPLEDEIDEHLIEKWGPPRPPSPPLKGTVSLPETHSDFPSTLATIEITLPHANVNILKALQGIWQCVTEIQGMNFGELLGRPAAPLEGFVEDHKQHYAELISNIRREIQPNLSGLIMSATNDEVPHVRILEQPRYQKLLMLVNHMQKDALRSSVEHSISHFTSYLGAYDAVLSYAPQGLGGGAVENGESSSAEVPSWVLGSEKLRPIFYIRLVVSERGDGSLEFSPPLTEFEARIPELVVHMAHASLTLPALEVATIDLKFHEDPLVPIFEHELALAGKKGFFRESYAKTLKCMKVNLSAISSYRNLLREYSDLLALNVDEYTANFAQKNKTLASYKFEIEKNQRFQDSVQKKVEDEVMIGMFLLDCRAVKNALAEINAKVRSESLRLLRDQAYEELTSVLAKFAEIHERLSKVPANPKELADVTEYVQSISGDQVVLQQRTNNVMKIYQALEDFSYEVTQEEFGEKYDLFAWPRVIKKKITEIEKINQVERLKMIKDLRTNQKSLETKVYQLSDQVIELDQHRDLDMAITVGDKARSLQTDLDEAEKLSTLYQQHEKLFDFPPSSTATTLPQLLKEFEPIHTLWITASDWVITYSNWISSSFTALNSEQIAKTVSYCSRVAERMLKTFKSKKEGPYNASVQLKQRVDAFKVMVPLVSKLRHPGIRSRHWEMIATELNFRIPPENEFTLGYVMALHLEQSFETISKLTDVAINEYALETALEKMASEMRARAFSTTSHRETYTVDISPVNAPLMSPANAPLSAPSSRPSTRKSTRPSTRDGLATAGNGGSTDEIGALIEDQLVVLQTMHSSPFVGAFLARVRTWKSTLLSIKEIVSEWLLVQKGWLYLAPIFQSPDINRQLPSEGRKYAAVDSTWRKIMTAVHSNPKVLVVLEQDKLLQQLQDCNKLLEQIMKGLNDYLDIKRAAFPRFYFLSNEELIDILAQNGAPEAVQPHLRKCFENVVALKFGTPNVIKAMISAEGEKVALSEDIGTEKEVEGWLNDFESVMRKTIKKILQRALAAYAKMPREQWMFAWPAQVVLATNQIVFTQSVHRALTNYKNPAEEFVALHAKTVTQLAELAALLRGTSLTPHQRSTATAILVNEVHNRETLAQLISSKVDSALAFEWQGQMRYYWEDDKCIIRMVQSSFDYGYEYLGNTTRLIQTPLTDRAFRSLTSALAMNLGAAPTGPAGTGKTETVKDLAKAVAKQCIVFNCSAGLDVRAIGKIFRGVASTGAWACFDEFNRMEVDVLSVVAAHILTLQQAVAESAERFSQFTLDGANVRLDKTCALFITMNPSYAGRSELPDNLKALFRPVAMVVPDYNVIAETFLYAEGFQDAGPLARKLVACFQTATEQLSQQCHYDWGLRAIKTVLSISGNMRRKDSATAVVKGASESHLFVRALRESSITKLVASDIPLFDTIVAQLFPTIPLTVYDKEFEPLLAAITESLVSRGLQPLQYIINKCLQLYQTLPTRAGIMLVGAPLSGKTTVYRILADAMNLVAYREGENNPDAEPIRIQVPGDDAGEKEGAKVAKEKEGVWQGVDIKVVHPKGLTLGQLFGKVVNSEWQEGLMSSMIREMSLDTSGRQQWIVLDGPVDPLWIESMNTVLDDNRILCLTNGERIPVPKNIFMIFETSDLSTSSPNTVSRCAMIYMDSGAIGWIPLIKSWASKVSQKSTQLATLLEKMLLDFLHDALAVVKLCNQPLYVSEQTLVTNMLNVVDCFLTLVRNTPSRMGVPSSPSTLNRSNSEDPTEETEVRTGSEEAVQYLTLWMRHAQKIEGLCNPGSQTLLDLETIETIILLGLVWALGGTLDRAGRATFDGHLRERLRKRGSARPFPNEATVFDYFFDWDTLSWKTWATLLDSTYYFNSTDLVHTPESISRAYLMEMLVRNGFPVLLCGESASGKTLEASNFVFYGLDQTYVPLPLSLSHTSPVDFIMDRLESHVDKRKSSSKGATIAVPMGKKLVVFVDDLHAPQPEEYGTRPPIEFLREFLGTHGWYDRKERLHFREGEEEGLRENRENSIVLIGAMTLPKGGIGSSVRPEERFTRFFNVIHCPEPTESTIIQVVSTQVKNHIAKFGRAIQEAIPAVIQSTVGVYSSLCKALIPTTSKQHYLFTPLDIFKVFRSLVSISSNQFTSRRSIVRWWVHEAARVFGDRIDLKDQNDIQVLWKTLFEITRDVLHSPWVQQDYSGASANAIQRSTDNTPVPTPETVPPPRLTWTDLASGHYEEISLSDSEKVVNSARSSLNAFNVAFPNKSMELHLFGHAVEHIMRILRILRQPQGHALLLGSGGSGRQSLARLATYIAGFEIFELPPAVAPTSKEWRDELKILLRNAGLQQKHTVILLNETRARDFLEDVNNLIHSGIIPDLFTNEEIEAITSSMRALAAADTEGTVVGGMVSAPSNLSAGGMKGIMPIQNGRLNSEFLFTRFVAQVRARLHIVLCIDPSEETFKDQIRKYPTLVTSCTVINFPTWPVESLKSIAEQVLANITLNIHSLYDVANSCTKIHNTVINNIDAGVHAHSSKYLDLLSVFQSLLARKRSASDNLTLRLMRGLEKLNLVSDTVAETQQNLADAAPMLERATQETESLLGELTQRRAEAERTRASVKEEEEKATQAAAEAKELADSAEAQLAEALPALQSAIKAVGKLSRKDITEVKSFSNPPASMTIVIEALCIVFGRKPKKIDGPRGTKIDDYWSEAKVLLNDTHFLQKIADFDKENISEETILKLKPYINNPQFVPAAVEKVNGACKSFCLWIRALESHFWISKSVAPKRIQWEQANEALQETMQKLEESRASLAVVEQSIDALTTHYETAVAKKNELLDQVEDCKKKLVRAHKLIGGLGGERVRWEQMVMDLKKSANTVLGDALLAAAYVTYMAPFSADHRAEILAEWKEHLLEASISYNEPFMLSSAFSDPVSIRKWHLHGLLHDANSVENAIMASESQQWPLFIDPQGLATKWVLSTEKAKSIVSSSTASPDFVRVLTNAIRFGNPLLVDISDNSVDLFLDPVLMKQTFLHEDVVSISIGDAVVPYHENFKLYIVCKHPDPHFPPELCAKVNIINFGVTRYGLEDELLTIVVHEESQDLESQKSKLEEWIASNKATLKEMEDKILHLLYQAEGNLLEDEELIDTLAASKKTSIEIATKLEEAVATEKTLDDVRVQYAPVAQRAAMLYQSAMDLTYVDPMYQFSLSWFVDLFVMSINESKNGKATDKNRIPERVAELNEHFTYLVYKHVSGSIFENHKLLHSFMLAVKLADPTEIDPVEWKFFISGFSSHGGSVVLKEDDSASAPPCDWLSENTWLDLCKLCSVVPRFRNLTASFPMLLDDWKTFYDSPTPQLVNPTWAGEFTSLQKLLLIRALRPEKLIEAIQMFVSEHLGAKFIEAPPFDLPAAFNTSGPTKPIIFLLAPGEDPTELIFDFAVKKEMNKRVHTISLGQNQGPSAERQIAIALERGNWVLLQNCHLAVHWLVALEKLVLEQQSSKVHPQFRLWLTSAPHLNFPVSLLRSSVKLCSQSSKGIRGNLLRNLLRIDREAWDSRVSATVLSSSSAQNLPQQLKQAPSSNTVAAAQAQGVQVSMGGYVWPKLVYGLCLFHAVVVERTKFGSLGWNHPYKFSDSDLAISMKQLESLLLHNGTTTDKTLITLPASLDSPHSFTICGMETARYMISECYYGGRVTDEWDRKCLQHLLSDIFNVKILNPQYKFGESGIYGPPEPAPLSSILTFVRQLPMNDPPEAFGFHETASIAYAQTEISSLFSSILAMRGEEKNTPTFEWGGVVRSSEEAAEMAAANILSVLPADIPLPPSPVELNNVLRSEIMRYNALLAVIRSTLQRLLHAQRGLVVLTPALEKLRRDLLFGIVPQEWRALSHLSCKPLALYLRDLRVRVAFVHSWASQGSPKVMHMGALFSPKSLIMGILQQYALKHSVAIDSLTLQTTVVNAISIEDQDAYYVDGLFLEAGRWEGGLLTEPKSRDSYTKLPLLKLKPKQVAPPPQTPAPPLRQSLQVPTLAPPSLKQSTQAPPPQIPKASNQMIYSTPVYNTITRSGPLTPMGQSTNFVMVVDLPCDTTEHHWVKRGTAMFCQLPL